MYTTSLAQTAPSSSRGQLKPHATVHKSVFSDLAVGPDMWHRNNGKQKGAPVEMTLNEGVGDAGLVSRQRAERPCLFAPGKKFIFTFSHATFWGDTTYDHLGRQKAKGPVHMK